MSISTFFRTGAKLAGVRQFALAANLMALVAIAFGTGCNIHEKQDNLDMLMDWSGYWYTQGTEDRAAFERSKRLAEKVLEERPNDVMAKNILGYCMLKVGPWDSSNPREATAKKVFSDVIEHEPENYRANLGLGLTYYKLSRVQDRQHLDTFSMALAGVTMLENLVGKIDAAQVAGNMEAAVNLDTEFASRFGKFGIDIRRLMQDDNAFPTELYEALVPDTERHGSGGRPQPFQVREKLVARVNALLDAMQKANRAAPMDTAGFAANLDRLETLLTIANDFYRERYIEQLDLALDRFLLCEHLHGKYGREYHWVYEHIAFTYFLKATTLPRDGESAATRREMLQLVVDYLEKFHRKDLDFEGRRLERLGNPDIADLEANPYWSTPVQDFRTLMRNLVDESKAHRQTVIETLIDLHMNEFDNLDKALRWCDMLADAEVLFGNEKELSLQPVKHHFYRAEIFRRRAEKLEADFHTDPLGKLIVPDTDKADHRGWWLDAYREYSQFLQRAPVLDFKDMRLKAQNARVDCITRYPEFGTDSSILPSIE